MKLNRNNHVLERLQQVYSAVLELSEQGFNVKQIDLSPAQPLLTVTRDRQESERQAGELMGAKLCCGCEVLLVARGR